MKLKIGNLATLKSGRPKIIVEEIKDGYITFMCFNYDEADS